MKEVRRKKHKPMTHRRTRTRQRRLCLTREVIDGWHVWNNKRQWDPQSLMKKVMWMSHNTD